MFSTIKLKRYFARIAQEMELQGYKIESAKVCGVEAGESALERYYRPASQISPSLTKDL